MLTHILIYFILKPIDVLVIHRLMRRHFNIKDNQITPYQALAYIFYFLVPGVMFFYYHHTLINIIITILSLLFITLSYSKKIIVIISMTIKTYAILVFSELLASFYAVLYVKDTLHAFTDFQYWDVNTLSDKKLSYLF